jgi:hypothetical protein
LFASARAQSAALPVAGMIMLLLPAFALLARRWRKPPLYLATGATYAMLAGIVRLAGNDVTTVVSTGFARDAGAGAPTSVDTLVARSMSANGLRIIAIVACGLVALEAVWAARPGVIWGSHAIGQLVALAARPGLGPWWGGLVAVDGIIGAAAVFAAARALGASVIAAALAGLLWAVCPARTWPLASALAPTFLVPVFAAALLLRAQRPDYALCVAGAAAFAATAFAPADALAMLSIAAAFALGQSGAVDDFRRYAMWWTPWLIAAIVLVLVAPQRVADALAASGALLGAPDAIRSLAGDGALPWEAVVPATLLAPLMAAAHHAGVVLSLCISPGIGLIAGAIAFAILRPRPQVKNIAKVAALSIAFGLYVALPSQWAGVELPTPAAVLATIFPAFTSLTQAGLGISVFCALLIGPALDALFAQATGAWRMLGAAAVAASIVASALPLGPSSDRLNASPTIAAESWAAQRAHGVTVAYYPLTESGTPRAAELAYIESAYGARVLDLHLSAADRNELSDVSAEGVARALRARGVRYVIVEPRAYDDPLVTPALAAWVWLPGDLRNAAIPLPQVPNDFTPVQAFDDGAIIVYAL